MPMDGRLAVRPQFILAGARRAVNSMKGAFLTPREGRCMVALPRGNPSPGSGEKPSDLLTVGVRLEVDGATARRALRSPAARGPANFPRRQGSRGERARCPGSRPGDRSRPGRAWSVLRRDASVDS